MKQRSRSGRKAILYQWLLLAAVCALVYRVVAVAGPIPVLGNLHDVFLPLNAVTVVEHDIVLQKNFLSPFGPVYFWLHWGAWQIHEWLMADASAIGVLTLASFLFALVPLLMIGGLRLAVGTNPITAPWLAVFVVALAASPRNQGEYSHKDLLWYGLYNNQLWGMMAVLIAALAVMIAWPRVREQLRERPARQALLAVILASALYVAFHYKISFFLTGVMIVAAILIVLGAEAGRRVGMWIGVFASTAVLATWLAGYHYPGYFETLQHAVQAKREMDTNPWPVLGVGVLAAAVSAMLLAGGTTRSGERSLESFALALAPAGLVTAGVAIGVVGDFSGAGSWLWLLPAFAALVARDAPAAIRYIAIAFFAVHILLDTLSLARVDQLRAAGPVKGEYEAVTIGKAPRRFDVLLESGFRTEPDRLQAMEDRYEAWIGTASFSPSLGAIRSPEVWNAPYTRARQEAVEWLRKNAKGLVAGEVEFVNGATWLADMRPAPGPHWIHLGTTVAAARLPDLWRWYREWDVVLVPVLSIDGHDQMMLACNFFRFNRRHEYPFELVDVTPHWLYFVSRERSEALHNPALKPWREYDRNIAQGNCRARAQSIW